MKAYIWTHVVIGLFGLVIGIIALAAGVKPKPATGGWRAGNLIVTMCFVAWGGYLLLVAP